MADFYTPEPREQISQGDVIVDVAVSDWGPDGNPIIKVITCLLLSHDCEIDKQANEILLVAELCALNALAVKKPGVEHNVRSNRLFNAMHIPAHAPDWEESYLDFRYIFRAKASAIRSDGLARRRASLSDESRLALGEFLFRFFTRISPQLKP